MDCNRLKVESWKNGVLLPQYPIPEISTIVFERVFTPVDKSQFSEKVATRVLA